MKIIEIKSKNYTAKINLTKGANCISLKNTAFNVSILREPDYENGADNPFLYGMPILFPVNRIHTGKFTFENRTYTYPINEPATDCHLHGFVCEREFKLEDYGESFAVCSYYEEKREGFPHDFKIVLKYRLDEDGLQQTAEITNLSDMNMPAFLGFHTTFNVPFVSGSSAENCRLYAEIGDEIERNMANYLPTGKIPAADDVKHGIQSGTFMPLEKTVSKHYRADGSGLIELCDAEKRLKIVYRNDSKYKYRLFYNGDASSFICLEPMSCMANCQNSPFDRDYAGFSYVEPNKTEVFTSEIRLVRMD